MMVVSSLSISTRFARPSLSTVTVSSFRPSSSATTVPPVRIAMSSSIAFRRSPNPGALTAHALSTPRRLFTTSVASASPSISSAMTSSGLPAWTIFSSTGRRSAIAEIFLSWMRTSASSRTVRCLSGWLMK